MITQPVQSADEIQKTPYPLLGQFEWSECTVEDPKEIDEIYRFLNSNYVEDDDAMFRFDYGRDFLQWALMPPGYGIPGDSFEYSKNRKARTSAILTLACPLL